VVTEPIYYCDWCKQRLEWDDDKGYWVCTNPSCRWNAQGHVGDVPGIEPRRPKD
jgi:hypothetical protein